MFPVNSSSFPLAFQLISANILVDFTDILADYGIQGDSPGIQKDFLRIQKISYGFQWILPVCQRISHAFQWISLKFVNFPIPVDFSDIPEDFPGSSVNFPGSSLHFLRFTVDS